MSQIPTQNNENTDINMNQETSQTLIDQTNTQLIKNPKITLQQKKQSQLLQNNTEMELFSQQKLQNNESIIEQPEDLDDIINTEFNLTVDTRKPSILAIKKNNNSKSPSPQKTRQGSVFSDRQRVNKLQTLVVDTSKNSNQQGLSPTDKLTPDPGSRSLRHSSTKGGKQRGSKSSAFTATIGSTGGNGMMQTQVSESLEITQQTPRQHQNENKSQTNIPKLINYKAQNLQSFNSIYHRKILVPMNIMQKMSIIKKAIKRFKSKPGIWNKGILDFINDKSYIYSSDDFIDEQQEQSLSGLIPKTLKFVKQISVKASKIMNKNYKYFPVIDPTNKLCMAWDYIQIFLISFIIYLASISLVFDYQLNEVIYTQDIYFRSITFISFIIHIILNLNIGYFEQGSLVMVRTRIIKRYINRSFLFDLLSLLPFIANMSYTYENIKYQANYALELLIFLKYFTLTVMWKRIQNAYSQDEYLKTFMKLIKLIIMLLNIAHLSALGFFKIAQYEKNIEEVTWAHQIDENIYEKHWLIQYIYSFYWAISAMVTVVVYQPVTLAETIFMCIIQFVTCGIFAYSINILGSILSDISKMRNEMQIELEIIHRYMNKRQLSTNLRNRITNYIEYLHSFYQQRITQQEEIIVEKLSFNLRESILQEYNGKIIDKFQFFKDRFSQKTIQKLIYHIEEINMSQYDQIYSQSTQDDCAIYFIYKGSIEIYHESIRNSDEDSPVITDELLTNQVFGLHSFITGVPRESSARSKEWGTLYKITRQNFIQVIKSQSSHEYEKFCFMKDEILNNRNIGVINEKCQICERSTHKALYCQNAHYIPNGIQIIKQENHTIIEQRVFKDRKNNYQINKIWTNFNKITSMAVLYYETNQSLLDEDENSEFNIYENQDDEYDEEETLDGDHSVIWENSEEQNISSCQSNKQSMIEENGVFMNAENGQKQQTEQIQDVKVQNKIINGSNYTNNQSGSKIMVGKSKNTSIDEGSDYSIKQNRQKSSTLSYSKMNGSGLNIQQQLNLKNLNKLQMDSKNNTNDLSSQKLNNNAQNKSSLSNETFSIVINNEPSIQVTQVTNETKLQQMKNERRKSATPSPQSFSRNSSNLNSGINSPMLNKNIGGRKRIMSQNLNYKPQSNYLGINLLTPSNDRRKSVRRGSKRSDISQQDMLQSKDQQGDNNNNNNQFIYSPTKQIPIYNPGLMFNNENLQVQNVKRGKRHSLYQRSNSKEQMQMIQNSPMISSKKINSNINLTNTVDQSPMGNSQIGDFSSQIQLRNMAQATSPLPMQRNSIFFQNQQKNQQQQQQQQQLQPSWVQKTLQETKPRNTSMADQRRASIQNINIPDLNDQSINYNNIQRKKKKDLTQHFQNNINNMINNNSYTDSLSDSNNQDLITSSQNILQQYQDNLAILDFGFESIYEYIEYYPEGNCNFVIKKCQNYYAYQGKNYGKRFSKPKNYLGTRKSNKKKTELAALILKSNLPQTMKLQEIQFASPSQNSPPSLDKSDIQQNNKKDQKSPALFPFPQISKKQ